MAGDTPGQPVAPVALKRLIKLGMRGLDVKACKRAAARAGFPHELLAGITDTYTEDDVANIRKFQQANGLDVDGKIGQDTLDALEPHMDALALQMYDSFDPSLTAVVTELVYPHPVGVPHTSVNRGVPLGLHPTGGIAHNFALDFMAPGGTIALAPEAGRISQLTGHDPSAGVFGKAHDIFGLSIHLITPAGLEYFATHLGDRAVVVGQNVNPGDILGHVGHWPHDPGRSHTHLGVSHPNGDAAAKDHIFQVAAAPRVAVPPPA